VWALSGTPTPKNNPLEYWTILSTLFPKVALNFGVRTPAEFQERFCITSARMVRGRIVEKVVGIKKPETLKELMGHTMLRRSPEELSFRMPPVFKQFLSVDLNEDVPEPEFAVLTDKYFPQNAAMLLRDPELARYRHKVGDAKAGPIARLLIDQLENSDEKVVVFAHHRSVLDYLLVALADFGVAYIDGDTPSKVRAEVIDVFQNNPQVQVFLGQTIACHTGITLTAASRVVLVEPDWTDAVNVQAAARVARIGQTKETCIVQYVVAAGTLDEGIIRSLAREAGMGETLYGS
jgi:SNF2 family DNA or RNA helicase